MRRELRLAAAVAVVSGGVLVAYVTLLRAPERVPVVDGAGEGGTPDASEHTFGYTDGGDKVDEWIALAKTDASPWHFDPDAARGDTDADYLEGRPKYGASIGHTSVVFKITFDNGQKAAVKPASRRGPTRYKGEIAAYRLALALGVDTVPRAFFRAIPRKDLASVLGGEAGEVFAKEVLSDGDAVRAAVIPWIPKLEMLPLEAEPWWSRFRGWLKRGAEIPSDSRALARDASIMIAFDYVTGNWDRWSGANVGIDRERGRLRFIDNDGAFFERPPEDALAKNRGLLSDMDRFSRAFVNSLRALDEDKLALALGEETHGVPLLPPSVLRGVDARRREVLALVDRKIAAAGEADTLFFE